MRVSARNPCLALLRTKISSGAGRAIGKPRGFSNTSSNCNFVSLGARCRIRFRCICRLRLFEMRFDSEEREGRSRSSGLPPRPTTPSSPGYRKRNSSTAAPPLRPASRMWGRPFEVCAIPFAGPIHSTDWQIWIPKSSSWNSAPHSKALPRSKRYFEEPQPLFAGFVGRLY